MIGEYIVIVGLFVVVISLAWNIKQLRSSLELMRHQRHAIGQRLDRERATVDRLRKDRLRLAVCNDKR